jgi:predicted nucleic acid-binding protein
LTPEEAAIALSREIGADALLIDDPAGRQAAAERGVGVIGTLGVLERASERGLIRLADVVPALERSDLRISTKLVADAIRREQARRRGSR